MNDKTFGQRVVTASDFAVDKPNVNLAFPVVNFLVEPTVRLPNGLAYFVGGVLKKTSEDGNVLVDAPLIVSTGVNVAQPPIAYIAEHFSLTSLTQKGSAATFTYHFVFDDSISEDFEVVEAVEGAIVVKSGVAEPAASDLYDFLLASPDMDGAYSVVVTDAGNASEIAETTAEPQTSAAGTDGLFLNSAFLIEDSDPKVLHVVTEYSPIWGLVSTAKFESF